MTQDIHNLVKVNKPVAVHKPDTLKLKFSEVRRFMMELMHRYDIDEIDIKQKDTSVNSSKGLLRILSVDDFGTLPNSVEVTTAEGKSIILDYSNILSMLITTIGMDCEVIGTTTDLNVIITNDKE